MSYSKFRVYDTCGEKLKWSFFTRGEAIQFCALMGRPDWQVKEEK